MADAGTAIKYQKCFIAYLDILGFKVKVLDSRDSSENLKILIESLNVCGAFPSGGKKAVSTSEGWRNIDIQSRFFSDTIVFFMQEDKKNLTQLLFVIRYLQDRLWEKGICLRGVVNIGDMHWPERGNNITVGPGLIEAHNLETEIAVYPRIVVSRELFKYINQNDIQSDPFAQGGNLKDYVPRDEDGIYFLDLLRNDITRFQGESIEAIEKEMFTILYPEDSGSKHQEILDKVTEIIEQNVNSEDEKVRQKYEWLRSYLSKIEGKE